jgi:hypothetical protein
MIIPELSFSVIIALVFSVVFAWIIRKQGARGGFFWFFLIILLATWAGGIWIAPIGPVLLGVYWLPFIFIAFVFSLILSISAHDRKTRTREETLEEIEGTRKEEALEELTYVTLNLFFWFLLAALAAAIVIRYLTRG